MRIVVVVGTPWRSGGNSVLHHIVESINKLGTTAVVTPIDEPARNFWSETYPDDKIIVNDQVQQSDVLLVPEEFIFMVAFLAVRTINYVIINQGFGSSFNSNFGQRNNYYTNVSIYNNAKFILANSKHTRLGITNWFGIPEENVIDYQVHVEDIFYPRPDKTNTITYMSRKNFNFAKFVINYLEGKYMDWEFVDMSSPTVSNTPESIAEMLARSKIFLSFGGPEGLGLPPIEAALAGNKVIGFDGGGGGEYFYEPVFTPVPFGGHYAYLLKVTEQLPAWKHRSIMDDEIAVGQINNMRKKYSYENSVKSIENMLRRLHG